MSILQVVHLPVRPGNHNFSSSRNLPFVERPLLVYSQLCKWPNESGAVNKTSRQCIGILQVWKSFAGDAAMRDFQNCFSWVGTRGHTRRGHKSLAENQHQTPHSKRKEVEFAELPCVCTPFRLLVAWAFVPLALTPMSVILAWFGFGKLFASRIN
jgi:hypothetical protein